MSLSRKDDKKNWGEMSSSTKRQAAVRNIKPNFMLLHGEHRVR